MASALFSGIVMVPFPTVCPKKFIYTPKVLLTPGMESAFSNICKSVANFCVLTIPLLEDMSTHLGVELVEFYRGNVKMSGKQRHFFPGR